MLQIAPEVRLVAPQGHKEMRREVDSHTHRSVEPEALHIVDDSRPFRTDNDAAGVADDVHQDTGAVAVGCLGTTESAAVRTVLKRVVAEAGRPRACVAHLLVQGIADVRIQQDVLGAVRENEALTWAGMGSLAVQTCWD